MDYDNCLICDATLRSIVSRHIGKCTNCYKRERQAGKIRCRCGRFIIGQRLQELGLCSTCEASQKKYHRILPAYVRKHLDLLREEMGIA